MQYTAINIGPIIATLQMARKPRELGAASYLFSHLMKCIYEELGKKGVEILSPAKPNCEKIGVGLYPDRVYVKDVITYQDIEPCLDSFIDTLKTKENEGQLGIALKDYFNVMIISGEYNKESDAISGLNQKLDCLELYNRAIDSDAAQKVSELIRLKFKSPLFGMAFTNGKCEVKTLAEYASAQLAANDDTQKDWEEAKNKAKVEEMTLELIPEEFREYFKDEGDFYKHLKQKIGKKLKSHHKYICIVQADGDNVGKTVSHPDLEDGKVKDISKALLDFGEKAKTKIEDYGGLPIYAGGDDLLFIAPVVGKTKREDGRWENILNLLEALNDKSFRGVSEVVKTCNLKKDGKSIEASLSFGVSITYYKYPLYEALESARSLLFEKAKNVEGKNAIALDWRKHSGSAFSMSFSKTNSELAKKFEAVIKQSQVEETLVSAVAHKIRNNEGLLKLWMGTEESTFTERNKAFFEKYMEYDSDKTDKDALYKRSALELLNELYKTKVNLQMSEEQENESISEIIKTMYAMLRVAKFIKGEEDKQ